MRRAAAAVIALFLISACATVEVGRQFDLAAFEAKVVPGVTTMPTRSRPAASACSSGSTTTATATSRG